MDTIMKGLSISKDAYDREVERLERKNRLDSLEIDQRRQKRTVVAHVAAVAHLKNIENAKNINSSTQSKVEIKCVSEKIGFTSDSLSLKSVEEEKSSSRSCQKRKINILPSSNNSNVIFSSSIACDEDLILPSERPRRRLFNIIIYRTPFSLN